MTGKIVVLCTCGSDDEAEKIAGHLVEKGLAACVNIAAPIRSVYRWQGKVERGQEWLLLIKTSAARFEELSTAIRRLHSYEVPEVIALPIAAGSPEYLNWIEEGTHAG